MISKKQIKVAIDSPAAAGAGTQAKLISKHYNLFYLDTGKIYRLIANIKITQPKKYNLSLIKKRIKKLKMKDLENKKLLSDEIGTMASVISKNKNVRKLVNNFQIKSAYNPPKKYKGSCLDGRDITYKIIPDAEFCLILIVTSTYSFFVTTFSGRVFFSLINSAVEATSSCSSTPLILRFSLFSFIFSFSSSEDNK